MLFGAKHIDSDVFHEDGKLYWQIKNNKLTQKIYWNKNVRMTSYKFNYIVFTYHSFNKWSQTITFSLTCIRFAEYWKFKYVWTSGVLLQFFLILYCPNICLGILQRANDKLKDFSGFEFPYGV